MAKPYKSYGEKYLKAAAVFVCHLGCLFLWLVPFKVWSGFDNLVLNGEDLRALPLSMRKANLERLLARRPEGIFHSDFERGEIDPDLFGKLRVSAGGSRLEASRPAL